MRAAADPLPDRNSQPDIRALRRFAMNPGSGAAGPVGLGAAAMISSCRWRPITQLRSSTGVIRISLAHRRHRSLGRHESPNQSAKLFALGRERTRRITGSIDSDACQSETLCRRADSSSIEHLS